MNALNKPVNHNPPPQTCCPACKSEMRRVPRSPLMRLIPGSVLFHCEHCYTEYLKVLGRLFRVR